MTCRVLLAFLTCSIASSAFADDQAVAVASDAQITTPTYTLAGSKVETKTAGDLALIHVSGDAQLRWQRAAYGDVRIASDQITLKATVELAKPDASPAISCANCVGRCQITTDAIRCTCDEIKILSGGTNELTLSGNVKLTCGDTKLTSDSCTIRLSGDSPTIIGEFRVPKAGG